jgi:hypothetical protein
VALAGPEFPDYVGGNSETQFALRPVGVERDAR